MSSPELQGDLPTNKQPFRLPVVATLITLVAIVIMLRLGYWQMQRADQKLQRLAQIEQRSGTNAMSIEDVLALESDINDFPVQAAGVFDNARYFLLDNRVYNKKIGYEVIVPFRTTSYLLLVNLGWVPAPVSRDELPEITLPQQPLTVAGTLSQPSKNPFVSQVLSNSKEAAIRIQEVDLIAFSRLLNEDVLPFILQMDPTHDVGFERDWKPVVMSPEKHWAYAVQWFGLALACAVVYGVAVFKRSKSR